MSDPNPTVHCSAAADAAGVPAEASGGGAGGSRCDEEAPARLAAPLAQGRLSAPGDIAEALVYFASRGGW
jgi:hypothetical protein